LGLDEIAENEGSEEDEDLNQSKNSQNKINVQFLTKNSH
jgi:hypothetical protein